MHFVFIIRRNLLAFIIPLFIVTGCGHHTKKGQSEDDTYVVNRADTILDVKAILKKSNDLEAVNKMDDATKFLSVNVHRFSGKERAQILNARAESFYLKDDLDDAISDYLMAMDLDSTNTLYLLNVAKTYSEMANKANASFFANKILESNIASDSDKAQARAYISP